MNGPYALVRHPLYLGNLLLGIGFALAAGTVCVWALPLWGLLFWLYHYPAIKKEDSSLSKRFPDAWPSWAAETPALLPLGLLRKRPAPPPAEWSLGRSLRNGEPLYAVILLADWLPLLPAPKH